mmetsp:Transcript_70932/g.125381  ORF Transcript_70932/g.125381 Transcript_70932/m.125381 type:complete len:265 (+) Transcript_70932:63-857(+)
MGAACSDMKKAVRRAPCQAEIFAITPRDRRMHTFADFSPRMNEPNVALADFDGEANDVGLSLSITGTQNSRMTASEKVHDYFEMVSTCSQNVLQEHRGRVSRRVSSQQLLVWLLAVFRHRATKEPPVFLPEIAVLIQRFLGDAWDAAPPAFQAKTVHAITTEAIPRAQRELDDVVEELAHKFISEQIIPVASKGGYAISEAHVEARVFRVIGSFGDAVRNGNEPEEIFRRKLDKLGYVASICKYCETCNDPTCELCRFTLHVAW